MDAQHLLVPHPGAETLVVAFTSYGADGAPAKGFEWQAVLAPYPVHKLFLRDVRQHWYLGGVEGFSCSMQETAERVRELMAEVGATRVVTIGSSMGAHGALHLASLLRAEALAFAPLVDVTLAGMRAIGDPRCLPKIMEMEEAQYADRNLGGVLWAELGTVYSDPSDDIEAAHVAKVSQACDVVHIHGAGHHVGTALRESGALQAILEHSLTPIGASVDVLRRHRRGERRQIGNQRRDRAVGDDVAA